MQRPIIHDRIEAQRLEREAHGRTRVRRSVVRRDGVGCEVEGRWLLDFCGNDYLGLAQHFAVVDALQDSAARNGAGGVASHLVCGHHAAHDALEQEMADWLGTPRALLFGSGYAANLAVVQSLLGDGDTCVQDKLNHASLIDAARLADCRLRRYPHGDVEGAIRQLKAMPEGAAMIATDGIFSMDGDAAPLRELALVARAQRAMLYVDDAHGIGVRGPDGRGSVAAARLDVSQVPLQLATLGKALGSYGAVLCGDDRAATAMSAALEQAGFWVAAIRPPTVPEGSARLRITLTTGHDRLQIDALLHALAQARDQLAGRRATAPA